MNQESFKGWITAAYKEFDFEMEVLITYLLNGKSTESVKYWFNERALDLLIRVEQITKTYENQEKG